MTIIVFSCRGHPNVQAQHESTLELTKDGHLTVRGDCVVCIACKASVAHVGYSVRGLAKLVLVVMHPTGAICYEELYGEAPEPPLSVELSSRFIVRKSSERRNSIMIKATKASRDLRNTMRELLASSFAKCYALLIYI